MDDNYDQLAATVSIEAMLKELKIESLEELLNLIDDSALRDKILDAFLTLPE